MPSWHLSDISVAGSTGPLDLKRFDNDTQFVGGESPNGPRGFGVFPNADPQSQETILSDLGNYDLDLPEVRHKICMSS